MINTSMVNRKAKRSDIHILEIPGTELAEEMGDKRLANSILLGALLAEAKFLKPESIEKALEESLHGKKAGDGRDQQKSHSKRGGLHQRVNSILEPPAWRQRCLLWYLNYGNIR